MADLVISKPNEQPTLKEALVLLLRPVLDVFLIHLLISFDRPLVPSSSACLRVSMRTYQDSDRGDKFLTIFDKIRILCWIGRCGHIVRWKRMPPQPPIAAVWRQRQQFQTWRVSKFENLQKFCKCANSKTFAQNLQRCNVPKVCKIRQTTLLLKLRYHLWIYHVNWVG